MEKEPEIDELEGRRDPRGSEPPQEPAPAEGEEEFTPPDGM
jgi:hypothetical protein